VVGLLVCCLFVSVSAVSIRAGRKNFGQPGPRFPSRDPNEKPLTNLARNPLTETVWGAAREILRGVPLKMRGRCPSVNNSTCSGHGHCAVNSASVFGLGLNNVQRYTCLCGKDWYGSGCHLSLKNRRRRQRLRKELLRVLNSRQAGALATPAVVDEDGVPLSVKSENDPGAIFGRNDPNYQGVRVKGTRLPLRLLDRYQPANSILDRWASPDDSDFASGGGVLAAWERERMYVQVLPDYYTKSASSKARIRFSKNRALYTSEAGRTIRGPLLRPGQKGLPMLTEAQKKDPRFSLPDPAAQKLLQTLNELAGKKNPDGTPVKAALD